MVSGSQNRTFKIWNAKTGEEKLTLKGNAVWEMDVALNHDVPKITGSAKDGSVKAWNATSDMDILSIEGLDSSISALPIAGTDESLAVRTIRCSYSGDPR